MHHSDQGSQYTSEDFQRCSSRQRHHLQHEPTRRLLGQRGDGELLREPEEGARSSTQVYRTRDEARADVFDYVERFYNPRAGTRQLAT